jgi:mannose-1-phosphate guanylyltransferase
MSKTFAVIMAGGVGTRFWPRSRKQFPKQFLDIVGSGSLLENTIARIAPLVDSKSIFVVTNKVQSDIVSQQAPFIPQENVLAEPIGRNTAPCIGLAASWIRRLDSDALMVVSPADHIIRDNEEFLRILKLALQVAEEREALVTIGISPTHPATGYGYIQTMEEELDRNSHRAEGVYQVKTFAEKPNLETAERFLRSGDFLWNSGIFVWKASTILKEIELHLPELHEELVVLQGSIGTPTYPQALEHAYGVVKSISIDYGVMEKAGNVFVVKGEFGWSDVGSWDEVVRLSPTDAEGNSLKGRVIMRDASGNFIDAGNKLVAAIGVQDLIVISTDDAVLICKKGESQDVKEVVDFIRRKQMNDYL